MIKDIESREREKFSIPYWHNLFLKAQIYRATCGWEEQANDGTSIRKNKLPMAEMKALPGWKGRIYLDNWLWKGIKLNVSMQSGAQVNIDVKGYDGMSSEAQELLENEINYAAAQFDYQDTMEDCQYDRYYTGFGVLNHVWNSRRIIPNYYTGTPSVEWIDPYEVYLDPATRKRDMGDCNYIFQERLFDTEQLLEMYPEARKHLPVTTNHDTDANSKPRTKVYTVQYRKNVIAKRIFIEDRDTGTSQSFHEDEWKEHLALVAQDPATLAMYEQEQPGVPFEAWLAEGGFLPEKVVMVGPIESEEPMTFQAHYIHDINYLIAPPEYVGKSFTYHFLMCYTDPGSAYPVGMAGSQKDNLELSSILMTMLAVMAAKQHKNEKLIQEDSLVNQKEYMERGYEIGMNPIVKEDWQRAHPGVDAVKNIPLPDFPQALMIMNEHVTNAQKSFTGATDASMGLASFAGESGVKVAQLQMASRVYMKEDLENYRRFIKSVMESLKEYIAKYRNYPHRIQGIGEDNKVAMLDVATHAGNMLSAENYYVEITIQENQEVVKQMEKEVVLELYKMGIGSDIDLLRKLDIPNPEKYLERSQESRGEKKYIDAIKSDPQLRALIDQFLQQAGTEDAPTAQPAA